MLLQVLFCLFAVYMLTRYLPLLRGTLSRDPERRPPRATLILVNVVLAIGILLSVLVAVLMRDRWAGLISR
jgi:hypothetical protein